MRKLTVIFFIFCSLCTTTNLNGQCTTAGLDTDNDGVPDIVDVDDDNDGISDMDEGSVSFRVRSLNNSSFIITQSNSTSSNIGQAPSLDANLPHFLNGGAYMWAGTNVITFDDDDALGYLTLPDGLSLNPNGSYTDDPDDNPDLGQVYANMISPDTEWVIETKIDLTGINLSEYSNFSFRGMAYADDNIEIICNGNSIGILNGIWYQDTQYMDMVLSQSQLIAGENTIEFKITNGANTTTGTTFDFELILANDTDNDGLSDQLDADSDNDGIFDAIEATGDNNLQLTNGRLPDGNIIGSDGCETGATEEVSGPTNNQGYWNLNQNNLDIFYNTGNVGIGTENPDAKLAVKGQVHAQEVKVDLQGAIAPDYVFAPDYKLITIKEVEEYVKANKHLPEIPSAKQMEMEGVKLKEMNLLLLKKIEELTLYAIKQQKEIIKQQKEIEAQQSKNTALETRLNRLEQLLNNFTSNQD